MSKSLRNVLTSIALIEAMIKSLEAGYRKRQRNKSVLALTEKAISASQKALQAWPGQIDPKGMKKIATLVSAFEKRYGETSDFTFFSATSLAILDDILRNIKDGHRRELLENLLSAINRIHRYFDRNLDKAPVYQQASRAVSFWHAMEA